MMPKGRVFWWRVLRGILPVERTLQHRHIVTTARCKVCLAADEDLMHALVKCTHAKRFWGEARGWLQVKLPALHPETWMKDILCDSRFQETDRAKIVSVMWAIWTSRNNITHDRESLALFCSMKMIRDTLSLLELPQQHARIIPGHGWSLGHLLKMTVLKSIPMLESLRWQGCADWEVSPNRLILS